MFWVMFGLRRVLGQGKARTHSVINDKKVIVGIED